MTDAQPEVGAPDDDAVHNTVAAWYATERLAAECRTYLQRSTAPSAVLWLAVWHPLPGFVRWLAVLTWGVCAAVALIVGVAAVRRRRGIAEALPEANRVIRFHFAASPGLPAASELLFMLSLVASG